MTRPAPPPGPRRLTRRTAVVLFACASLHAVPQVTANAQVSAHAGTPVGLDRGPLLTGRDLVTLGTAALGAAALVPFDARIARWSQQPGRRGGGGVRAAAATLRFVGDPGVLAAGAALFGAGAAFDRPATAAVGLHSAAAIVTGGVVTGAIKGVVGRARPYVVRDSDATDVRLGRGLRRGNAFQAFPSGHATAAFAFAGALAAEGRSRWPGTNRWTAPAGFAVAGLVAASRVYHDRHWASDVVFGAGVGATAGAALVRYTRSRPRNELDRRLLPRAAAPRPIASWTVRF